MSDIKFMIAKVKGYVKRYTTKNGKKKEIATKTINLGANAPFEDGDAVIVIKKLDYDDIMNQQANKQEIDALNEDLNEIQRSFTKLDTKCQEQLQEIQELKTTNKTLTEKWENSKEKTEILQNNIILAQNEINKQKDTIGYQDVIIAKYEEMGLLNRVLKKNPKDNTPKPETLEIPTNKK